MICNLIDLIYLEFLIFCLCNYIYNCKVDINSCVHNNKVPSQFSPDQKSPSFRTHTWDNLCWSAGTEQSHNWSRRLVLRFKIVFWLGIEWLLRLSTTIPTTYPHTHLCISQTGATSEAFTTSQTGEKAVRLLHKLVERPTTNQWGRYTIWWSWSQLTGEANHN